MKNILVLCTANSCRSQMAEGYLRFFTDGKIAINSAGLGVEMVNPHAIEVMREDNIDISDAISKDISSFTNQHFEYILWICTTEETDILEKYKITADKQCYFDIPDPKKIVEDNSNLSTTLVFSDTREIVKKEILRFIGKHLALPVSSETD